MNRLVEVRLVAATRYDLDQKIQDTLDAYPTAGYRTRMKQAPHREGAAWVCTMERYSSCE